MQQHARVVTDVSTDEMPAEVVLFGSAFNESIDRK